MKLDHWASELPEFGTPMTIIALVDERDACYTEIASLRIRLEQIDREIQKLVLRQWTNEEIEAAKKAYIGLMEDSK